jgi:tetratricopeptide (TPR) repeat protein
MRRKHIIISSGIFVILLVAAVLFGTGVALCFDEDSFNMYFYEGNSLYQRGDFDRAAKTYERILSENMGSASLYYNLGNTYVKLGDYGRALLNYERARHLAPRDPEILANIKYVTSLLSGAGNNDGDSSDIEYSFRSVLDMYRYFTVNELVVVTSIFYVLVMVLIGIAILKREMKVKLRLPILIFCVFLLFCLTMTGLNIYNFHYRQEAIVLVGDQVVRFEPASTGTVYFPLKLGEKVVIRNIEDDWAYITSIVNKKSGWVPVEGMGIIF